MAASAVRSPQALAALLGSGLTVPALAPAAVLIALCAVQTLTYFCVPSAVLALWDRARSRPPLERPPYAPGSGASTRRKMR